MKKLYLYIGLFYLLSISVFGQSLINNNWQLGLTDLGFTNTIPSATTVSNGNYGLADVSDSSSNLLFYTNGTNVWNKNHAIMTNGANILDQYNANIINSVIVPNPANSNQYFIFTSFQQNCLCLYLQPTYYVYSTVEFNTSNPLGIVNNLGNTNYVASAATAYTNFLSDSSGVVNNVFYFGPLTVTETSDGSGYWVILQSKNKILSYKIDTNGFNSIPVESNFSSNQIYSPGVWDNTFQRINGVEGSKIRITPNNIKLIGLQYSKMDGTSTSAPDNSSDPVTNTFRNYLYTLDFDSSTGLFTNYLLLSGIDKMVYEFEISNNSNNLYFVRFRHPSSINLGLNILDGEVVVKDLINNSTAVRVLNEFNTTTPTSNFNYIQKDRNGNILLSSTSSINSKNLYIHKVDSQDSFTGSSIIVNHVYLNGNTIARLPQLIPEIRILYCLNPLTLNSEPNTGLVTYQHYANITTQTAYTVNLSTQNINLRASDFISLKPGTTIKTGSVFSAKTQPCTIASVGRTSENSSSFQNETLPKLVKLYPNPNNGSFTIELYTEVKDISIAIFDTFGKQVYNTTSNGITFDVNTLNLPSGLYLVKLSSNEINETLKFIKQ